MGGVNTTILIRKATLEDLKMVNTIETLCFKDGSYPLFVLRQFFDISENYFLIAEENNEILGYALGNITSKTKQSWILSLGVHPNARGKQIGKKLTKQLLQKLEENNTTATFLTVHPDNKSAIKIYEDLGFKIASISDNYYLDNHSRLVMKKQH